MCSIARQKRGLDSQSDDPSSEVRLWVLMGKGVGLLEVVSVAAQVALELSVLIGA